MHSQKERLIRRTFKSFMIFKSIRILVLFITKGLDAWPLHHRGISSDNKAYKINQRIDFKGN